MPPAPHSAPYDDTAIKARLGAVIGTMFLVMPGELRGALLAADGDLVRASPDLDLITARYQAMTNEMAADLAVEARNAARSDPSRFADDAAVTAVTTDILRDNPGWILAMVGAGAFEEEENRPGPMAALAFGREMATLTAALRSTSGPEESDAVLQRAAPGTEMFAQEVTSILRASIEAGPDEASQIAALPMAADIVRAIPGYIHAQLKAPAPPTGSALGLMFTGLSDMMLRQLREIGEEMTGVIADHANDRRDRDAALDGLIVQRQPEVAAMADRTQAVSDAWAAVAGDSRSPEQQLADRQLLAEMRDLSVLRARAESAAGVND